MTGERALDLFGAALWRVSDWLWPNRLTYRFAHWLGRKALMIRDRNEEWMKNPLPRAITRTQEERDDG